MIVLLLFWFGIACHAAETRTVYGTRAKVVYRLVFIPARMAGSLILSERGNASKAVYKY